MNDVAKTYIAHNQYTQPCGRCGHGLNWHTNEHGCTADGPKGAPVYKYCGCLIGVQLVQEKAPPVTDDDREQEHNRKRK